MHIAHSGLDDDGASSCLPVRTRGRRRDARGAPSRRGAGARSPSPRRRVREGALHDGLAGVRGAEPAGGGQRVLGTGAAMSRAQPQRGVAAGRLRRPLGGSARAQGRRRLVRRVAGHAGVGSLGPCAGGTAAREAAGASAEAKRRRASLRKTPGTAPATPRVEAAPVLRSERVPGAITRARGYTADRPCCVSCRRTVLEQRCALLCRTAVSRHASSCVQQLIRLRVIVHVSYDVSETAFCPLEASAAARAVAISRVQRRSRSLARLRTGFGPWTSHGCSRSRGGAIVAWATMDR